MGGDGGSLIARWMSRCRWRERRTVIASRALDRPRSLRPPSPMRRIRESAVGDRRADGPTPSPRVKQSPPPPRRRLCLPRAIFYMQSAWLSARLLVHTSWLEYVTAEGRPLMLVLAERILIFVHPRSVPLPATQRPQLRRPRRCSLPPLPPPPPRASRLRRTLSCRPRKRIAPDRADGRTAFLTFSLARPRPPRPVPPSPNGTTATAPVRKERAPEEVTRFDSCGLRLPYARPVSSQSHRNGRQRIGLLGLVGARPGVLLREFHFARSTSAPLRPLSYLGLAGGGGGSQHIPTGFPHVALLVAWHGIARPWRLSLAWLRCLAPRKKAPDTVTSTPPAPSPNPSSSSRQPRP